MKLWKWFRSLRLGVQIFFVLAIVVLFLTLVPSPFTE